MELCHPEVKSPTFQGREEEAGQRHHTIVRELGTSRVAHREANIRKEVEKRKTVIKPCGTILHHQVHVILRMLEERHVVYSSHTIGGDDEHNVGWRDWDLQLFPPLAELSAYALSAVGCEVDALPAIILPSAALCGLSLIHI